MTDVKYSFAMVCWEMILTTAVTTVYYGILRQKVPPKKNILFNCFAAPGPSQSCGHEVSLRLEPPNGSIGAPEH